MNSFFRRPLELERPSPSLNDCDLEAQQQQAIEGAGHTEATHDWRAASPIPQGSQRWTATDADGNSSEVDPSVYRRDDE